MLIQKTGFRPNFNPNIIHLDLRPYLHLNTTGYGFWPSFHPKNIHLIFGQLVLILMP